MLAYMKAAPTTYVLHYQRRRAASAKGPGSPSSTAADVHHRRRAAGQQRTCRSSSTRSPPTSRRSRPGAAHLPRGRSAALAALLDFSVAPERQLPARTIPRSSPERLVERAQILRPCRGPAAHAARGAGQHRRDRRARCSPRLRAAEAVTMLGRRDPRPVDPRRSGRRRRWRGRSRPRRARRCSGEADEAIYARRNAAVEQERRIKESELNTEIAVEEKQRADPRDPDGRRHRGRGAARRAHRARKARTSARTPTPGPMRSRATLEPLARRRLADAHGASAPAAAIRKLDDRDGLPRAGGERGEDRRAQHDARPARASLHRADAVRTVAARPMFEKIVVVTRKTRLEELVERFNTRGQAQVLHRARRRRLRGLRARGRRLPARARRAAHASSTSACRVQLIDRALVPTFLFAPSDLVVDGRPGRPGRQHREVRRRRSRSSASTPIPSASTACCCPSRRPRRAAAVRGVLDGTRDASAR